MSDVRGPEQTHPEQPAEGGEVPDAGPAAEHAGDEDGSGLEQTYTDPHDDPPA